MTKPSSGGKRVVMIARASPSSCAITSRSWVSAHWSSKKVWLRFSLTIALTSLL